MLWNFSPDKGRCKRYFCVLQSYILLLVIHLVHYPNTTTNFCFALEIVDLSENPSARDTIQRFCSRLTHIFWLVKLPKQFTSRYIPTIDITEKCKLLFNSNHYTSIKCRKMPHKDQKYKSSIKNSQHVHFSLWGECAKIMKILGNFSSKVHYLSNIFWSQS